MGSLKQEEGMHSVHTEGDDILNTQSAHTERLIYADGTPKAVWMSWQGIQNIAMFKLSTHLEGIRRVLIVAPHPDDEILGCAGLMQHIYAYDPKIDIIIIAVTNGTASHPHSRLYSAEQLNQIRPQETLTALHVLQLDNVQRIAVNIQDGEIQQSQSRLHDFLKQYISPHDLLISTYEKDGHPDHEYTAHVVKDIAHQFQLRHLQVLIWAWHWAQPNDPQIDWEHAYRLDLSHTDLEKKRQAIDCFQSQIEPDPTTQAAAILSANTIDRILMPYEVYLHV